MKQELTVGVKDDFPALTRKVKGNNIIYLDSAATSLTPHSVIDALTEYYEKFNANIHRGIHSMGEEATLRYERAHAKVAAFINASPEEVIFTKNTTESLNLVAYSLTEGMEEGDNVVLTEMEHHSNLVPWQQLAKRRGFEVRYAPVEEDGTIDMEGLKDLVDENTGIVSVAHASNFLGTVNPVEEIASIAHDDNALFVVDAAQSVPHMPVDVKEIGADFLAFSGHKMLGPNGVGVLYGQRELLSQIKPFLYGGDMIKEVSYEDTTFNELPWKFEAGTPAVADALGLAAAVDYLGDVGMERVMEHSKKLGTLAAERLEELGAEVYGPEERIGLVSFNLEDIHPHDVSTILDDSGIAVRGGHHCVMPLHKKMGLSASCRASFHIYNTEEDVDALIDGLEEVREVFS